MKKTIKSIISVISAAAILSSNAVAVSADSINSNMISSASIYYIGAKKPAQVVVNKKYSSAKTAVRISWGKVAKASGYRIYIYDRTSKTWKKFKTVRGRTTTNCRINGLKPGTKYKFRVKAYRKLNGKTYWGKTSVVKNTVTAPKTTKLKLGKYTYDTVNLSWNKVNCSKYVIQKKENGSWKNFINVSNSETSYKITGLTEDTDYSFRIKVVARDLDKNISKVAYSNSWTLVTPEKPSDDEPAPSGNWKKYDYVCATEADETIYDHKEIEDHNYWYEIECCFDFDNEVIGGLADSWSKGSQDGLNEACSYAREHIEIFDKAKTYEWGESKETKKIYMYIGY